MLKQDTVWLVPRRESKFKEVPYQSYRSKTLKTVNFCQKWPNFCLKWPKFRQIRIFQAYRVWFPQRIPQEQLPYHKLGRFIAAVGSYRSRTLNTVNFGQKMALNEPNFAISEFSQHIEYDFLKEDHKNIFHTKN